MIPSLSVDQITKNYYTYTNSLSVLKDINLSFLAGRIYGVSGSSGCGKSTLLSLLAGCIAPDSGKIEYKNRDGSIYTPDQARKNQYVSYIPQSSILLPELSVYENIECALLLAGISDKKIIKEKINYWAEICKAQDLLNKMPSCLSGGQKQRVAFVRACIIEPQFLLLDEATVHLDQKNREHCMHACRLLVDKNRTGVIMVSHDLEVLNYADEIVHLF